MNKSQRNWMIYQLVSTSQYEFNYEESFYALPWNQIDELFLLAELFKIKEYKGISAGRRLYTILQKEYESLKKPFEPTPEEVEKSASEMMPEL